MKYISYYESVLGTITMASDGKCITGLWFDGQKYDRVGVSEDAVVVDQGKEEGSVQSESALEKDETISVFEEAKNWLDRYFAEENPEATASRPPLALQGTDFQKEVWEILLEIPYGKTTTYGEIAKELARRRGAKTMSAQAVGGAVGHNKISILVPCHRVVGADGKLTGYAGGIEKKKWMLEMESRRFPEDASEIEKELKT
ncbi:MAG: methylated-DNA--[protein]-cysteine S-methyltransferase [Dorea sp.]|nr:methylated-DNA--[protein]-cysteine S-methyltransferase [Dorea sp.]